MSLKKLVLYCVVHILVCSSVTLFASLPPTPPPPPPPSFSKKAAKAPTHIGLEDSLKKVFSRSDQERWCQFFESVLQAAAEDGKDEKIERCAEILLKKIEEMHDETILEIIRLMRSFFDSHQDSNHLPKISKLHKNLVNERSERLRAKNSSSPNQNRLSSPASLQKRPYPSNEDLIRQRGALKRTPLASDSPSRSPSTQNVGYFEGSPLYARSGDNLVPKSSPSTVATIDTEWSVEERANPPVMHASSNSKEKRLREDLPPDAISPQRKGTQDVNSEKAESAVPIASAHSSVTIKQRIEVLLSNSSPPPKSPSSYSNAGSSNSQIVSKSDNTRAPSPRPLPPTPKGSPLRRTSTKPQKRYEPTTAENARDMVETERAPSVADAGNQRVGDTQALSVSTSKPSEATRAGLLGNLRTLLRSNYARAGVSLAVGVLAISFIYKHV